MEKKIDDLIAQMTLDEKVGQLSLPSAGLAVTGPVIGEQGTLEQDVAAGRVGGIFNAFTVDFTTRMQKIAMTQTRLKIPLIFGFDVIHGFRTVFPMPLAEAASWDLDVIHRSARIASVEAASAGLHWTYAPMVDIARDARWGRVVEGAGEDPYLGSKIAEARVLGIQGNSGGSNPLAVDEIFATVKHFAGYGAVEAGRDYNTVDISEATMRDVYLRPFKAAVDAGVGSIMTAFNEWNGIPCTENYYLITKILRDEWKFPGFVVTDYTSIPEMIKHGVAADLPSAALLAKKAGVDMDMQGGTFLMLPQLVAQGKLTVKEIDDSVRRILRAKYLLGLFDDPYRYSNAEREKQNIFTPANIAAAKDSARKSIVLLKNGDPNVPIDPVLPLSKTLNNLAVIGPLASNQTDINGSWVGFGQASESESLVAGIRAKLPNLKVTYSLGADIQVATAQDYQRNLHEEIPRAVKIAQDADAVVVALGESWDMSGEASSRSNIGLPGLQDQLLEALYKTGKPIVLVLMNGRPLTLVETSKHASAILETWFLGTKTGSAIADVLFGDYNPSGKLPISFPRVAGVPVYYNHKNTGRPAVDGDGNKYESKYLDVVNAPLYPFGFGLSYTTFNYDPSSLKIQVNEPSSGFESATISVTVQNTGAVTGKETVQLYVHDEVGRNTRPVKELKGFQQVTLEPGKSQKVTFNLKRQDLMYFATDTNEKVSEVFDPGFFTVMVGGDSNATLSGRFQALR